MELINDRDALIDRVSLYNIQVREIKDFKLLQDKGILVVKEKSKHYLQTAAGEKYSYIKITDADKFDMFSISVGIDGCITSTLELSVPDDGYHNLNCLDVLALQTLVSEAQACLAADYGIVAIFDDIKYRSIEINKTIVLNDCFERYHRVLKLMMYLLPNNLRLQGEREFSKRDMPQQTRVTDFCRTTETYCKSSGEKGLMVKVYDKTMQLEEAFRVRVLYNYLRYEITLKSPNKINNVFGTNSVFLITDDMINDYFSNFVFQNIEKPFAEYKRQRDIAVYKILKKHYVPGSRKWVQNVIIELSHIEIKNEIPVILDVADLMPGLTRLKFTSKDARCNAKKSFNKVCEAVGCAFWNNDGLKYTEIIKKLS